MCCLRVEHSTREVETVHPASSHMLISKIKPCMYQFKHLQRDTGRMAHQGSCSGHCYMDHMVILELSESLRGGKNSCGCSVSGRVQVCT